MSTTVLCMVQTYLYVPGVVNVIGPNVDPALCVGLALNGEASQDRATDGWGEPRAAGMRHRAR